LGNDEAQIGTGAAGRLAFPVSFAYER